MLDELKGLLKATEEQARGLLRCPEDEPARRKWLQEQCTTLLASLLKAQASVLVFEAQSQAEAARAAVTAERDRQVAELVACERTERERLAVERERVHRKFLEEKLVELREELALFESLDLARIELALIERRRSLESRRLTAQMRVLELEAKLASSVLPLAPEAGLPPAQAREAAVARARAEAEQQASRAEFAAQQAVVQAHERGLTRNEELTVQLQRRRVGG